MPLSPEESGISFKMNRYNDFDVTALPFTSISRENWQMLVELDADTLYDVIHRVGSYVLTGEECDCENTLSKVVCHQMISVIDRKGQKSRNSSNNLRKKKEVPVQVQETEPSRDDDWYFEEFLSDPAMDYSTLLGNLDYFKQRKARELNDLYKKLGRRYTGDQILQILREKYASKLNNQEE